MLLLWAQIIIIILIVFVVLKQVLAGLVLFLLFLGLFVAAVALPREVFVQFLLLLVVVRVVMLLLLAIIVVFAVVLAARDPLALAVWREIVVLVIDFLDLHNRIIAVAHVRLRPLLCDEVLLLVDLAVVYNFVVDVELPLFVGFFQLLLLRVEIVFATVHLLLLLLELRLLLLLLLGGMAVVVIAVAALPRSGLLRLCICCVRIAAAD